VGYKKIAISNNNIHYQVYDGKRLFASRGNRVYVSKKAEQWEIVFQCDRNLLSDHSELYRRLVRGGIHHIIAHDNYVILVIRKRLVVIKDGKAFFELPIWKGYRPLRRGFTSVGDALYFGDYWGNPHREPVNIYKFSLSSGIIETFATLRGFRHIHFIIRNQWKDKTLLVGTGDRDEECGIFEFDLVNKQFTPIGRGSQIWRAVSALQSENFLYWGSDCPYIENHIFRYNRKAGRLDKLTKIDGPAYYSAMNKDGKMFIATTIEDRKIHRAIIYKSDNGEKWEPFKEFRKDVWNEKLFGYGIIEFIQGQELLSELYINLVGLKE